MFELRADDAFRFQAQAVAVEAHCRFQIVDADCRYADSWFRRRPSRFDVLAGANSPTEPHIAPDKESRIAAPMIR
ncbi:hypothetical protein [Burkholderia stagnalis]|uniref:hypothetical protein n=1 Tax=Burkholderia stagnalis TaxID=1503054 RepID=UPI000B205F5B|nr:hypothetical protein [Burkholderia stagnalis]